MDTRPNAGQSAGCNHPPFLAADESAAEWEDYRVRFIEQAACPPLAQWTRLADEAVDEATSRSLLAHAKECADCAAWYSGLCKGRAERDACQPLFPPIVPGSALEALIQAVRLSPEVLATTDRGPETEHGATTQPRNAES